MEIRNLTFSYGDHKVLKNLSCKFEKGKITTILGSNGSGKSTLFKLCTRELRTRTGLIKLGDKNISRIDRKEYAKMVSIVHQQNRISEDIEVRELVEYGRNPHIPFMGTLQEKDHEMVDWALHMCGLTDLANKPVTNLSGGQLQRVWIAMSLAQDTDLVFLDEPTTYLDIKYQIEILDLIRDLNYKLGKTIVMVLHDINQSIEYSDIIIGLHQGRVLFSGDKEVLTEDRISTIFDTDLEVVNFRDRTLVLAKH